MSLTMIRVAELIVCPWVREVLVIASRTSASTAVCELAAAADHQFRRTAGQDGHIRRAERTVRSPSIRRPCANGRLQGASADIRIAINRDVELVVSMKSASAPCPDARGRRCPDHASAVISAPLRRRSASRRVLLSPANHAAKQPGSARSHRRY